MPFNKRVGFLLALFPFFNIYAIGLGISIGQFLLLLALFYYVCFQKGKLAQLFRDYLLYALIVTIWGLTYSWTNWVRCSYEFVALTIFFLILNFSIKSCDYKSFRHTYYCFGILSLCFFIFQYLLNGIGIKISGIIPLLPLSNEVSSDEFIANQLNRVRLSSFFQEPAHYAEYMTIFLSLLLFDDNVTKKKWLLICAISISILLSQSATGYVLLFVCFGVYFLNQLLSNKKNRLIHIFTSLIVAGIIVNILSSNEIFLKVLERYEEISLTPEITENGYSSYIRVLRGYIPYLEGDWSERLIGHGLGTFDSYLESHPQSMFLFVTDHNPNWINSFQAILFTTGIVGACIFSIVLIRLWRKTTLLGKALIIQYILMMFSSGVLLTPTSVIIIYIIYAEYKKGKVCNIGHYSSL